MKLLDAAKTIVASSLIALGMSHGASAATVCSSAPVAGIDVTSYVTGTSACEFSTFNNNDSNSVVNNAAVAFFGFTDWAQKVKDDNVDGVNSGDNTLLNLVFTGGANTTPSSPGTWSFNPQTGFQYMFVFKAGSTNNTLPGNLIAYLINASSGTYAAPNLKADGTPKTISHISLYARTTSSGPNPFPTPVPLPASALLLIGALGGLGVAARKKRKAV